MNRPVIAWRNHSEPLVDLPHDTHTPGIIRLDPFRPRRPWTTVQCSVCHRTATAYFVIALNAINFAADDYGTEPYRRCDDCRDARLHPEGTTR